MHASKQSEVVAVRVDRGVQLLEDASNDSERLAIASEDDIL